MGSPEASAEPRIFTRDFVAILLVQACFGYSHAAFQLLPKFLDVELGASASQIGVVVAVAGIAAVLAPFAVGKWVDRVGRRRVLAGAGLLMVATGLAFARVEGFGPGIHALRALQGVAFAMAFVAGSSLAVDEAPPERLGQAMGLFGLTMLSMNAVAPLATETLAVSYGWPTAFAAAALGGLACAGLAGILRERPRTSPAGQDPPSLAKLARSPRQRRLAAVVILNSAACGVLFTFHQTFALSLGIARVGTFFAAYASAAIVVRAGFGWTVDSFGRHRMATACLAVYAAAVTATIGLEWIGLVPIGVVFGAAHGLLYPTLQAMAVERAAEAERSRVMALFIGSFNLGFAGGPFAMGFLADAADYPIVFAVAGGFAFAALALFRRAPESRAAAAAPSPTPGPAGRR